MPSKTEYPPRERAEFLCDTAGSILSVHVRGEIDHHTAASIRQGIDATLFEKRPARLILDLSAVSFMDSSGLGLIMGRYSVMKELGGEMTVWNPSPETRAIGEKTIAREMNSIPREKTRQIVAERLEKIAAGEVDLAKAPAQPVDEVRAAVDPIVDATLERIKAGLAARESGFVIVE